MSFLLFCCDFCWFCSFLVYPVRVPVSVAPNAFSSSWKARRFDAFWISKRKLYSGPIIQQTQSLTTRRRNKTRGRDHKRQKAKAESKRQHAKKQKKQKKKSKKEGYGALRTTILWCPLSAMTRRDVSKSTETPRGRSSLSSAGMMACENIPVSERTWTRLLRESAT